MEPSLYRAAMKGNVEEVYKYTAIQLESQITPQSNNILQVASIFGHVKFVELVLQICPNLLQRRNNKLETPLPIAAKKCHCGLLLTLLTHKKLGGNQDLECELEISTLLDHQKLGGYQDLESLLESSISIILRAENTDGDTALHLAARAGGREAVYLLAKADPVSCSIRNKDGKTPLYLAAEGNDPEVVLAIIKNCDEFMDQNGLDGRTTLHFAVYQIPLPPKYECCIGALLAEKQNIHLTEVADAHGWLPLHYAAYYGNVDGVIRLLYSNRSTAYKTTEKNGKFTAIHIAAANGNVQTMKVILYLCPDCWETVDDKGRSILDIARYMEEEEVVDYIERQPWSVQTINQKTNPDNYLIARYIARQPLFSKLPDRFSCKLNKDKSIRYSRRYSRLLLQGMRIADDKYDNYLDPHDCIQQEIRDNGTSDDADVLTLWKSSRKKEIKKKLEKEKMENNKKEKMAETQLIVATLIATVTIAAGYTVPGGYNGCWSYVV